MTDYELFYLWESNDPIKDQFSEPVKHYGRALELGESITILGIEYVVVDMLGDKDGWITSYIVERKIPA